jgi:tRNA dimethylallyltransferase
MKLGTKFDAVLIAGPTAGGKSEAATELADQIGGVIINADSMQVYREAPVLTAQPTSEQRARAPHLLYGHVSARDAYSVGRYAADARAALAQAKAMARVPIFAGGTGLYFAALTDGLADIPAIPPDIRAACRALLAEIGVSELYKQLAARDPETAAGLRPSDPQRVLRAYEVFEATGRPLIAWQRVPMVPLLKDLRLAAFVLDPPRDLLRARIAARFENMLEAGGLDEAQALAGLDPALPAARLLGLKPLQALAAGAMTKNEAIAATVIATGQFAKRQMTWFRRRMAHYVWFDPYEGNIIATFRHIYT